jgi:sec-independent protein translocase protein TatA
MKINVFLDISVLALGKKTNKAKTGISQITNPIENIDLGLQKPVEELKENIEDLSGPIKRQS